MNLLKKCILGLALVAGVWFLPALFPMQRYLQQAEQAASDALGVPVKIGSARLMLLPTPRVVASQLTVGSQQDLMLQSMAIVPKLTTLWQSPKVVDVEIDGVICKSGVLAAYDKVQAKLAEPAADATPAVLARQIRLHAVDVSALVSLPVLDADIALDDNRVQSVHVNSSDRSLQLALTPDGLNQRVHVQLQQFRLPSTGWVVDKGSLNALLMPKRLQLDDMALQLLGGTITGGGNLTWQQHAQASMQFNLRGLSMQQISQHGDSPYLTGQLYGTGTVSAKAAQVGELGQHTVVQAGLEVKHGVLHGLDLVKIAKFLVKNGERGGETQFDTLRAQLRLVDGGAQLRQIQMASGLMTAAGNMQVTTGKQLDGDITVAVKQSAGMLEVPLEIGGSVGQPRVIPDKAATVGAAVGTVLMPGIGTGLGMKAGSKLKSWFGGN